MNLFLIFLTGLTTGGVSCLAMQGGLLASIIANQKDKELSHPGNQTKANSFDHLDWMPVLIFLVAKLVAYTIFGFLLGLAGSYFTLSLGVRLVFQVAASLFMFATAMNLLDVHPIFRFVVLQPPKFALRWVRSSAKATAFFSPALLGLMTIFVPCGVTQAMEVLAISSGSALTGAMIMFAFVLGTAPIFAIIGILTAKLSEVWNKRFLQFAALILVIMGLMGLNGVLTVLDAPVTVQKLIAGVSSIGEPPNWYKATETTQSQTIEITNSGYSPNHFTVKVGLPVTLKLVNKDAYSCAAAFTFRKFNISAQIRPSEEKTFIFTPTETGEFTYACSMGMYQGTMTVVR
jgi:sulfite exporter TauE/SafE